MGLIKYYSIYFSSNLCEFNFFFFLQVNLLRFFNKICIKNKDIHTVKQTPRYI